MSSLVTAAVLVSALSTPWQATWFAAPQPAWDRHFILPTNLPATLSGQTVREIVRTSVGGKQVRVQFSNRYGATPLTIGAVRIALAGEGGATTAGSSQELLFNGRPSVVVPPGAPVVSDPVDFPVAPLTRLAVSTYFPLPTPVTTFHWGEQQTALIGTGNIMQLTKFENATELKGRAFLSGVLVDAAPNARTVIAFGDSITDGNGSTPDANRRWPDALAQRLAGRGVAVINAGISGARLLQDKMGATRSGHHGCRGHCRLSATDYTGGCAPGTDCRRHLATVRGRARRYAI
jgi:hypothetical protein